MITCEHRDYKIEIINGDLSYSVCKSMIGIYQSLIGNDWYLYFVL